MKSVKKGLFAEVSRKALGLVGELRPEDGVDPRELAKRRRREKRAERIGQGHGVHKQEQFLSQVQTAIQGALQTATTPILNSLTVNEVVPQGGSLVVVVVPHENVGPADLAEATRALENAATMLRREVASAITRKETPKLSFVVLPPGAVKEAE
jgi:ribosome-binding factor A